MALLEVQHIEKRFGTTQVLTDISFSLEKGQALSIIGSSDKTAFFLLGDLIEYSDTETLFSTPKEKKTEDYITGRFG